MIDKTIIAIVILDFVAIFMTAGWILYGIYKGITFLEIYYNYVYIVVIVSSNILNIIKILGKGDEE